MENDEDQVGEDDARSATKLDVEWTTLNAVRELVNLASGGDPTKATYQKALEIGGEICPEILGESSLLRDSQVSATVREFKQRARLESKKTGDSITPLSLVEKNLEEETELLSVADRGQATDRIRQRVKRLEAAKVQLTPARASENQIINRDVKLFSKELPSLDDGHGYSDYELLDEHVLRVRALHPDKAEEITGADLIYERHQPELEKVELVMIQYKIWEGKHLYMKDPRMTAQLERLRSFTCDKNLCESASDQNRFRFPCCSAFLRPTDRLQSADQTLRTSGEHIPICEIEKLKSSGERGAEVLRYEDVKQLSLSHIEFESLFRSGKVGSRLLSYSELSHLYSELDSLSATSTVVIHAREIELPVDPYSRRHNR
ncbi:hypothetical protein [Planctomycetes bacterium K23_9]|uniref:Uncharacterized protein n=1 Tax=Stieleria marina TaxID=1930275 RepID=A0A517NUG5_9BACT|nr:hypothetical protein K239x_27550 [Planctomycetes bacterium K23_9]